jgi:hypothetical protein
MLTTVPPSVIQLSRQCGILKISQPYRPPRPVTGIALPTFLQYLDLHMSRSVVISETTVWGPLSCTINMIKLRYMSIVPVRNALPRVAAGRFNYCVPLTNVKCHTPTIHILCPRGSACEDTCYCSIFSYHSGNEGHVLRAVYSMGHSDFERGHIEVRLLKNYKVSAPVIR